MTESGGARRRSLSGASALLARRFTRMSAAPRPVASRSENAARRRATIASTHLTQEQQDNIKVHVRIVPNIENPSRSLIFDIVDRELTLGSIIKIGRYSERHSSTDCMSFKSKVVSRCHCEVWVETDGKLYIRDTKSSSGTFLNHVRLSPAGNESRAVELNDGDMVQLGVDFQGGREEMYRSVKMRFELNRSVQSRPLSYNLNAFQNLRTLTQHNNNTVAASSSPPLPLQTETNEPTPISDTTTSSPTSEDHTTPIQVPHQKTCSTIVNTTTTNDCHGELDECCICLYALAPFQALFVSPCSHTYHFKCIRPLLLSYPGFQCPICRTYSDLEASVAIETDEVIEKYDINNNRDTMITDGVIPTNAPPADFGSNLQSSEEREEVVVVVNNDDDDDQDDDDQPLSEIPVLPIETRLPPNATHPHSTTFVPSSSVYSNSIPDITLVDAHPDQQVIEDSSLSTESMVEDAGIMSTTDDDEEHEQRPVRERRTSHIMDKIKMVFFEKRKSSSTTAQPTSNKNRRSNRQRPLSYPNTIEGSSNHGHSGDQPLSQTLSRQSTTHLTENNTQPMVVDG